jgi:hypothetical protein
MYRSWLGGWLGLCDRRALQEVEGHDVSSICKDKDVPGKEKNLWLEKHNSWHSDLLWDYDAFR